MIRLAALSFTPPISLKVLIQVLPADEVMPPEFLVSKVPRMEQLVDREPGTAKQFGGFSYSNNRVGFNSLLLKHTSPFGLIW